MKIVSESSHGRAGYITELMAIAKIGKYQKQSGNRYGPVQGVQEKSTAKSALVPVGTQAILTTPLLVVCQAPVRERKHLADTEMAHALILGK